VLLLNPHVSGLLNNFGAKLRLDAGVERYFATGQFVAPKDGAYTVFVDHGDCTVDGKKVEKGELRLKAGLHSVAFNGYQGKGNHLDRCILSITDPRKKASLPIFNSLAAIKSFLSTPLSGHIPTEVSTWDPNKARALRVEIPGE
jgi:hypothetical protein